MELMVGLLIISHKSVILLINLDNQLIFPLIQKTIINESIQISLKNDDFTTIIEFVFSLNNPNSFSCILEMFILQLNHYLNI
jgi:hypothetical protein